MRVKDETYRPDRGRKIPIKPKGENRLDSLDIRISLSIDDNSYTYHRKIMFWIEKDYPNPTILVERLERLVDLGLIEFTPGKGYIETQRGQEIAEKIRQRLDTKDFRIRT